MTQRQNVATVVLRRHPELQKELTPRQLRIVKQSLMEVAELSARDILTQKETEQLFQQIAPDTGKPSAALRAYRKRSELTQRALADRCGIPQPHIAAMESGARPIGLTTAKN